MLKIAVCRRGRYKRRTYSMLAGDERDRTYSDL